MSNWQTTRDFSIEEKIRAVLTRQPKVLDNFKIALIGYGKLPENQGKRIINIFHEKIDFVRNAKRAGKFYALIPEAMRRQPMSTNVFEYDLTSYKVVVFTKKDFKHLPNPLPLNEIKPNKTTFEIPILPHNNVYQFPKPIPQLAQPVTETVGQTPSGLYKNEAGDTVAFNPDGSDEIEQLKQEIENQPVNIKKLYGLDAGSQVEELKKEWEQNENAHILDQPISRLPVRVAAAIYLAVPESGISELDAMIRKSALYLDPASFEFGKKKP